MNQIIHKLSRELAFLLACLILSTIATALLFMCNYYLAGSFAAVIALISSISISRLHTKNIRKLSFLLEAIENNDNAFNFSSYGIPKKEKLINESLNRINQILYNARQESIRTEKYYELILNCVNTGIVVLDSVGNVTQTNREALRLLGLEIFTHIKQLKRVDKFLEADFLQMLDGERKQLSFANETGNINLSLRSSEIVIHDKHFCIIALSDINNELAEKEIDSWIRLTRVLTHEIMNSVTPITSISDSLLNIPETNKEIKNGLEIISSTGKGLISFVESYRQFTHIPKPEPTLFYANKFAERMIKLAKHQTTTDNICFEARIEPSDLIIYADENLISQVVINLLKNAIQAIGTQKDGRIKVYAYCNEAEEIMLEISNNGLPIPPEVAKHIFIPFFTTKTEGNGIGLSISRQIMRLSGGSLSLKHSSEQETTFILTFN